MSVFIQISDTHFGTERPEVVEALKNFVRQSDPALVVLSGDVTQRARRSQFAAAERFTRALAARRVLVIPGNHDIPLFNPIARLFFPYANYARAFGSDMKLEFASDSLLVVCVNTTRRLRHTVGEVSDEQIERVASRLRRASSAQLRVVVTHQPVHVIRDSDLKNLLRGRERAVRSWSQAGADLFMGGHIHLPYVRPLSDGFDQLTRRSWVVQAGTAVSRRVRGNIPNSVNVVRYPTAERQVCSVERWDYDSSSATFQCFEAQRLELDRDAGSLGVEGTRAP